MESSLKFNSHGSVALTFLWLGQVELHCVYVDEM